jgi:uncharacterized protein
LSSASGRIRVHLTPRARREAIDGWRDGILRVRVTAPPIEGRANEALVRLIAAALKIAPSRVRVVAGASARTKLVEVEGCSTTELQQAFGRAGGVSRPKRSPAG